MLIGQPLVQAGGQKQVLVGRVGAKACGHGLNRVACNNTIISNFGFYGADSLGWRKSSAVGLAVLGLLLASLGGQAESAAGMKMGMGLALCGMLLVLAAVCSEAAHTLIAKVTTRNANPLLILILASGIACLLSMGSAIYQAQIFNFQWTSVSDWFALLWWSVATTAIGSLLWYKGISQVPASIASGFIGISPVSGVLLSYLILNDKFYWSHLAGFILGACRRGIGRTTALEGLSQ